MEGDNPHITKIQSKENYYPNPHKQKDILNYATIFFEELSSEEDTRESRNKTLNELLQLLKKKDVIARSIDLMYMTRSNLGNDKISKTLS